MVGHATVFNIVMIGAQRDGLSLAVGRGFRPSQCTSSSLEDNQEENKDVTEFGGRHRGCRWLERTERILAGLPDFQSKTCFLPVEPASDRAALTV